MKTFPALMMGVAAILSGCSEDKTPTSPTGSTGAPLQSVGSSQTGYIYSATNAIAGNAVAVFSRASDGSLTHEGDFATGGKGTGAALGSQGSLFVSDDGAWLFAVNAGSSEVSVFRISGASLTLTDKVKSGGDMPVSVAFRRGLLYVLNAKRSGNITAFTLNGQNGTLTALPGSTRPLSGADSVAPAQVLFGERGRTLIVTERATDLITTYNLGTDGLASAPHFTPSSGIEPFGFALTRTGAIVVSEAFDLIPGASAASSYRVAGGGLTLLSGTVMNGQTASCWVALNRDQTLAFLSNTGSSTISSYIVNADGTLTLNEGLAASTGAASLPIDLTVTGSGYLYVLNEASGEIDVFQIGANGTLTSRPSIDALPAFAAGIAQR
jgi:6-phosphogluconolactonase